MLDKDQIEQFEDRPIEIRPANCRMRLRDENKAYPRSGCGYCKDGGLRGCPYEGRRSDGKTPKDFDPGVTNSMLPKPSS